ncbi:MAG: cyclase family protein [Oscillospiraceae bacterium]|jgi:arylformamidase|nr:cyclase family protein [Oscillospiraceae bacterium]
MKIIDISQPLFEASIYPGDTPPKFTRVKTISKDTYNLTDISMCVHNGTHIDAPFHFLKNGVGVDKLPLDVFYGECVVQKWSGNIPQNCERLLIKGEHIITAEDANLLVKSGVRLVGVESQSVGDPNSQAEVHRILLNCGIVLLEGLVLKDVEFGEYTLSAFPLNLGKCDGSPVRAVLIK